MCPPPSRPKTLHLLLCVHRLRGQKRSIKNAPSKTLQNTALPSWSPDHRHGPVRAGKTPQSCRSRSRRPIFQGTDFCSRFHCRFPRETSAVTQFLPGAAGHAGEPATPHRQVSHDPQSRLHGFSGSEGLVRGARCGCCCRRTSCTQLQRAEPDEPTYSCSTVHRERTAACNSKAESTQMQRAALTRQTGPTAAAPCAVKGPRCCLQHKLTALGGARSGGLGSGSGSAHGIGDGF